MNSINEQQVERNHEDLVSISAVKKMNEIKDKTNTCFFCTKMADGQFQVRPMSILHIDEEGNCWFLGASDSHVVNELTSDDRVQLLFHGSGHSDLMTLSGRAGTSQDKKMIDALWQPIFKTWFTEGKDDPRITVIMFKPDEGYYWDNKHGNAVAFMKMAVGAVTGKTLDDSIEGRLFF